MYNEKATQLRIMLISDIHANHWINRLFSRKYRIRYDVAQSILETFEKTCRDSPLSAVEDLLSDLTKSYKTYEEQLVHFRFDVLYGAGDFPSYAKFKCKLIEAKIGVLRYWIGVISCL